MRIFNKRASFDYLIQERLEAGIALKADDIKAFREGKANLNGAYAKIVNGEVFLISSTMPSRKLLLHRDEISLIETKSKAKKLTLVPIKLYNKGHLVKLELALAKAKKEFQKKESIKKRDLDRDSKEY